MSTPIEFKEKIALYGVHLHCLSDAEAIAFESSWLHSEQRASAMQAIKVEKSKIDCAQTHENTTLGIEVHEVSFSEFDRRKTPRHLNKHLAFDTTEE